MKKTNRTFKRFAAITSASLLAACAVAPVAMNSFAATEFTITNSSNDKENHTYTAYQIFTGSYSENGLTVEGWASDINTTNLFASDAWKNFVVVDKVDANPAEGIEAVAEVKIGDTQDAAAVAQLLEKIQSESAKADALADIIYANINSNATGKDLSAENLSLSAGYYLIKDNYTSSDQDGSKQDAMSKYILKVTDGNSLEIKTKKSYPSVVKKVKENSNVSDYTYGDNTDNDYNDVADYNIGDLIDFKLYGTIPSTIDDYTNGYKYVFHDYIAESLTLYDKAEADGGDADSLVDVTVKIDNAKVVSGYIVAHNEGSDGFTVTFDDIKKAVGEDNEYITVTSESVVTVEYKAKLNDNAVIGRPGQVNKVYIEYSNNPEWTGNNNTTDLSPEDKVIVFTYELDVTKINGGNKAPLAGAKFKLADSEENGQFAKFKEMTREVTVVVDGTSTKINETYYQFDGWDTTGTEIVTPADGIFRIVGLDEDEYWLEETEAPGDFNKLEKRVKVQIIASTLDATGEDRQSWDWGNETNQGDKALTNLKIKVDTKDAVDGDINTGIVETTIENSKGTQLPGTGGIGTTIFYLGGGAMAAIGGVYLISKRRMKKSEE